MGEKYKSGGFKFGSLLTSTLSQQELDHLAAILSRMDTGTAVRGAGINTPDLRRLHQSGQMDSENLAWLGGILQRLEGGRQHTGRTPGDAGFKFSSFVTDNLSSQELADLNRILGGVGDRSFIQGPGVNVPDLQRLARLGVLQGGDLASFQAILQKLVGAQPERQPPTQREAIPRPPGEGAAGGGHGFGGLEGLSPFMSQILGVGRLGDLRDQLPYEPMVGKQQPFVGWNPVDPMGDPTGGQGPFGVLNFMPAPSQFPRPLMTGADLFPALPSVDLAPWTNPELFGFPPGAGGNPPGQGSTDDPPGKGDKPEPVKK